MQLFKKYGFQVAARKLTANGEELVLVKDMDATSNSVLTRYPRVKTDGQAMYLLALYPKWHTRLLPDSILTTEDASIVEDVSHTNSIHKVYLAAMPGMQDLRPGGVLVIYRTSDQAGPAHFRSVVTSVCVVEEYRDIRSFEDKAAFLSFCRPYSVFELGELEQFWKSKRYPHVVRFAYNFALTKRLTRGRLIEEHGSDESARWGFMPLTVTQFHSIIAASGTNESLIVN